MDNNINNTVKIKQVNPRTKLNATEKMAIKQYEIENKIKKDTDNEEIIDLPKEKNYWYKNTIKQLEEITKNKKNITFNHKQKVVKQEKINVKNTITHKKCTGKVIIDNTFSKYKKDLQKKALQKLSNENKVNVRKYKHSLNKNKVKSITIDKKTFAKNQKDLSLYAVNELYYRYALKIKSSYLVYRVMILTSIILCLFSGKAILKWYFQGQKINDLNHSITEETDITEIDDGTLFNVEETNVEETSIYWKYLHMPLSSVDFTSLQEQNSDTVGYIIVNNTNINYPVVQTNNNSYYLTHSFDRNVNYAGWVFADYRDNFNVLGDNTVIYAHGRKDKVMFGSLVDALEPSWHTNIENQIIQFSTLKYNTMWQIFSVYTIQEESYYISTDFMTRESFQTFIDTMKSRSIYNFNVDVNNSDKLLTLSTCFNDYGIRLVVQAKLVKIQERTLE